jgi:two-component system, chemotaxis family, protein-glutamate methylesterase/glutaminase
VAAREIILIGGSAGSIEAANALFGSLPADLCAAVFLVTHIPSDTTSVLPNIVSRAGPLPARHAVDGQAILPGRVYVAPPDRHMVLEPGHVRLTAGPKENRHRPAVDPLFRSAAEHYGARAVGIVLSGNQNDGTAGLLRLKNAGGIAMVQDPATALFPSMPRSALEHVPVDYVVAPARMGAVLRGLVSGTESSRIEASVPMTIDAVPPESPEAVIAREDRATRPGVPSTQACPECHGVLWESQEGDLLEFRCRVGHAYTAEALFAHQSEQLEVALWTALRALEEHQALAKRLAARSARQGHSLSAAAFTEQAVDAEHHASLIRTVLRLPQTEPEPETVMVDGVPVRSDVV